jgi:hypothetical protein
MEHENGATVKRSSKMVFLGCANAGNLSGDGAFVHAPHLVHNDSEVQYHFKSRSAKCLLRGLEILLGPGAEKTRFTNSESHVAGVNSMLDLRLIVPVELHSPTFKHNTYRMGQHIRK